MAPVWDWMREQLAGKAEAQTLNLFGYTGVGTLALSDCGPVTHVDASKKSVAQARENAALSGMDARPPSSPRVRSGAASATTASSSTRRNSDAVRREKCGDSKRDCRP